MAALMNEQRTISCNANCSLRRAISVAWSTESGRMTFKSPEPDATATSESTVGVGTCEVINFGLALPFPLFDNCT
jgi:hypothetical protein